MAGTVTDTTTADGSSIIVKEENVGKKVPYTIEGTSINFRNGELILDLAARQMDVDNSITVYLDIYNFISIGGGKRRIAIIQIPAAQYTETQTEDENGNLITHRTKLPFDISKCTLILWRITYR